MGGGGMRIAMIAPLEIRVPPEAYGGTELIVSLLTEELVKRGHKVSLFASGDSLTKANLYGVCPRFLRGTKREKSVLNMLNAVTCLEIADSFDIIHNHTQLEGMALAGLVKTPMLTTLHGDLKDDWHLLFTHYRGWFNTISYSARSLLPEKERFAGVIYNAIDVESYPFNGKKRAPYLLFLSRISVEKGPHLAIELAHKLGLRLIIAGNVDTVDEPFFKKQILPQVDNDQIQYIGEVNFERKTKLLTEAYCLLAPVTWSEPFGLFLVEAMVCGTPVVAFNRGSIPEIIIHEKTGFVVNTLEEMAAAVPEVEKIDPVVCRRHVVKNFDVPRMADDYLAAYENILQESAGSVVKKHKGHLKESLKDKFAAAVGNPA
jgi:glycosyltransferase involved in cell wall biosynthesis